MSSFRRPPIHRASLEKDKMDAVLVRTTPGNTAAAAAAVGNDAQQPQLLQQPQRGEKDRERDRERSDNAEREHSVSVSSVGHRPAQRGFHHQHTASRESVVRLEWCTGSAREKVLAGVPVATLLMPLEEPRGCNCIGDGVAAVPAPPPLLLPLAIAAEETGCIPVALPALSNPGGPPPPPPIAPGTYTPGSGMCA